MYGQYDYDRHIAVCKCDLAIWRFGDACVRVCVCRVDGRKVILRARTAIDTRTAYSAASIRRGLHGRARITRRPQNRPIIYGTPIIPPAPPSGCIDGAQYRPVCHGWPSDPVLESSVGPYISTTPVRPTTPWPILPPPSTLSLSLSHPRHQSSVATCGPLFPRTRRHTTRFISYTYCITRLRDLSTVPGHR